MSTQRHLHEYSQDNLYVIPNTGTYSVSISKEQIRNFPLSIHLNIGILLWFKKRMNY